MVQEITIILRVDDVDEQDELLHMQMPDEDEDDDEVCLGVIILKLKIDELDKTLLEIEYDEGDEIEQVLVIDVVIWIDDLEDEVDIDTDNDEIDEQDENLILISDEIIMRVYLIQVEIDEIVICENDENDEIDIM